MLAQNETFSRVLIDKALEFSGWDILDPKQVQFELHTGSGRTDYLLKDSLGRVLCVLEDKRDAYRIERLPSRDDLERLRYKNLQPPRPLLSEVITPAYLRELKHDLTLRRYQIKAIDEVARLFDAEARRKFLLEMATGTGK